LKVVGAKSVFSLLKVSKISPTTSIPFKQLVERKDAQKFSIVAVQMNGSFNPTEPGRTVAYNTALTAANRNLSRLEAVLKIGSQNRYPKSWVAVSWRVQMPQQEILLRDSFLEASRDLNDVFGGWGGRNLTTASILTKMEAEAAEERHKLQHAIERAGHRIQAARAGGFPRQIWRSSQNIVMQKLRLIPV
jgi:hypothetical protein